VLFVLFALTSISYGRQLIIFNSFRLHGKLKLVKHISRNLEN